MTEPRIAVVTGAARGIGAALARRMAEDGFAVAAYERAITGRRIDAFVVARTRVSDVRLALLRERHVPFVAYGRSTGSEALVANVVAGGGDAVHLTTRAECGAAMLGEARPGDRILILGARDDTLTEFGRELLEKLSCA